MSRVEERAAGYSAAMCLIETIVEYMYSRNVTSSVTMLRFCAAALSIRGDPIASDEHLE